MCALFTVEDKQEISDTFFFFKFGGFALITIFNQILPSANNLKVSTLAAALVMNKYISVNNFMIL